MSYISVELEQQPPTTNSITNTNETNHLGFQGHQEMVKVVKKTKPMPKRVKVLKSQARTVAAPVSIGTQISVRQPKVTRSSTGATIAGTDFIGTVEGQGVSTFGLSKSALLSPAYFSSAHIGSLCRSFERYKWRKLIVHYIPKVATSTGGQVILCSHTTALSRAFRVRLVPSWLEQCLRTTPFSPQCGNVRRSKLTALARNGAWLTQPRTPTLS